MIDAFRDVQRAKIDQQRLVNEAEAYRNDVVPRAHGDAAAHGPGGRGLQAQIVRHAEGDAARFLSVYDVLQGGRGRDRRRLYIETMESILQEHQQDHRRQGGARARACCPICRCRSSAAGARRRRRRPARPAAAGAPAPRGSAA